MNREIDLMDLIPEYLKEYTELAKILETETIELNSIESAHWELIDNRYFTTADENGLAIFEKILGIVPPDDATLEERRFKIASIWNSTIPYNYDYLYKKLTTLVGEDRFSILLNGLSLKIRIDLRSKRMMGDVSEMIEQVIPCNVLVDLMLQYNQYKKYETWTHDEMHIYKHSQLREDVIND